MKTIRTSLAFLAIVLALAAAISPGLAHDSASKIARDPAPNGAQISATVNSKFSYQGLLSESGSPVTGTRDMVFRFFGDRACGTQVGADIGLPGVEIASGHFYVELEAPQTTFNGQGLWLEVEVAGTAIACQEILPVPYALGLRPGAEVSAGGDALTLSSVNGVALRVASANGDGIEVLDANLGVDVRSTDADGVLVRQAGADGLAVSSATEDGLDVTSAGRHGVFVDSAGEDGLLVASATDDGLQIDLAGDNGIVVGEATGIGVLVKAAGSVGLVVESAGNDGARILGAAGDGIQIGDGTSYPDTGIFFPEPGTPGVSVLAATANVNDEWALFTLDKIRAGNVATSGPLLMVAQNGDAVDLEPGDVVAASGLGTPMAGDTSPLPLVRLAAGASGQALAGVVYGHFVAEGGVKGSEPDGDAHQVQHSAEGPIAPGEHLLLVVLGPAQVKAEAASGPVQAGYPLVASTVAGRAAAATPLTLDGVTFYASGVMLGTALENLAAGSSLIWVMVDPG